MANWPKFPVSAPAPGVAYLTARFFPNGASAPTGLTGKKAISVSRTAAGTFTITFEGLYATTLGAFATLSLASADDKFVNVAGVTTSGGNTVVTVVVWDISAGAVADVGANAQNFISVLLAVCESTAC